MASKSSARSSNVSGIPVKQVDIVPRKKPAVKTPPEDLPLLVQSAAEGPVEELGTVANRLFQEAKYQLEQSGKIKASIKEAVAECLSSLYNIVLRLSAEGKSTVSPSAPTASATDLAREVMEKLRQQTELVAATREDVSAIKQQMEKLNETTQQNKVRDGISYAAKAATSKPVSFHTSYPQPVHSMLVSSVDAHDTSDDVITKIRKAVSAKTCGIRVDRLRKAKDGKVVLGCQTQEELAKVTEKLKSGSPTLLMEAKSNRDPLVILRNVLNLNTDEDILGALKNQNAHILGEIPGNDYRVSVRYRRKARNPLESHVVLQVSPPVWQRLTSTGKIHVDLQRVKVEDQSPLLTCSKCLGYGHGRKACMESVDTCSHCAGEHLRSECPVWKAGEKPTCRNCQSSKLERVDHNSFNEACPIRKKWDALARSKVAYC